MVRRVESQTPQKKEEKMSCDGKDKLMIKTWQQAQKRAPMQYPFKISVFQPLDSCKIKKKNENK